jgi:hypothetical protein
MADTAASTHKEREQRKPAKVVSHIEIHPMMDGGHAVHTVHTQPFDHPNIVKKFAGPHESVKLPKGHILHHVGDHLGVALGNDVGAGEDSEQATIDKKESAEA